MSDFVHPVLAHGRTPPGPTTVPARRREKGENLPVRAVVQRVAQGGGQGRRDRRRLVRRRSPDPVGRRVGRRRARRRCACREGQPASDLRRRRRAVRPLDRRHGWERARREPVHADRGHGEGQPPELLRCRPSRGRRAALRALLLQPRRRRNRGRDGVFGARMAVELVNDGPVTLVLDTGPD